MGKEITAQDIIDRLRARIARALRDAAEILDPSDQKPEWFPEDHTSTAELQRSRLE